MPHLKGSSCYSVPVKTMWKHGAKEGRAAIFSKKAEVQSFMSHLLIWGCWQLIQSIKTLNRPNRAHLWVRFGPAATDFQPLLWYLDSELWILSLGIEHKEKTVELLGSWKHTHGSLKLRGHQSNSLIAQIGKLRIEKEKCPRAQSFIQKAALAGRPRRLLKSST